MAPVHGQAIHRAGQPGHRQPAEARRARCGIAAQLEGQQKHQAISQQAHQGGVCVVRRPGNSGRHVGRGGIDTRPGLHRQIQHLGIQRPQRVVPARRADGAGLHPGPAAHRQKQQHQPGARARKPRAAAAAPRRPRPASGTPVASDSRVQDHSRLLPSGSGASTTSSRRQWNRMVVGQWPGCAMGLGASY